MSGAGAGAAAERAARESYGRLVAILSARTRDVAAAEDALGEAFAEALGSWPASGVPGNPEAWLLTAARRRQIDAWRRSASQAAAEPTLALLAEPFAEPGTEVAFPDERLRLMFVCAHPAIDEDVRAPLMLQAVLGLDAARMAGAFVTSPGTLSQRLVRAKQKIRDAGIPFDTPEPAEWPQRLQDVMDGIYGAYGTGWDDPAGADPKRAGLAAEALQLAEALAALLPSEPEPQALVALIRFCEARAAARRSADGGFVPLSEQEVARWDREAIALAEAALARAARLRKVGPYQIEAAIQSAHCQSRLGAAVPDEALLALYDGLIALRPRLGAEIGRLGVLGRVHGPERALAGLDALHARDPRRVADHQPWWAVRAHFLERAGRSGEAAQAFRRAAALALDPGVRAYLLSKAIAAA